MPISTDYTEYLHVVPCVDEQLQIGTQLEFGAITICIVMQK
jgi:hypothetical protein